MLSFFTFIFYFSLILKATGRDGRDGRIFIIEDDFENNTIKFREKHQVRQDFSRFIRGYPFSPIIIQKSLQIKTLLQIKYVGLFILMYVKCTGY